ncbi:hypothetical protein A3J20_01025 [Candidatus Gottesmanbacteria bacterium RIFCSPLOWO2_02_FULL_42_29]|uniref:Uncharacterized protein n=2 Tax=Candidatus Gottesmaniibacteriota TaxID=1752720 RepID=A0A1F6BH82_9BACT|nr:MAG: hypothetical protein UV09_C0001G0033 [Candidatus Gottesmanbacteria bacterium GW2011_GWA2_42_18]KKS74368.1 MAG: hypothetical protein UV46_C0045G0002 [Candidatus Gottesmanbacteria bacterium GW2011_GWC2_42_8]OGG11174.1 MAG: hypothetical protein A2781_05305 [Candidatus Gottesmanbacteria bacterium RIFCSPHIGHO2_01_FULL_42_27]OGG20224.1 MAG: hypothetical protein A3E72_06625 [Candidatus Gottesmanbacteria bacterium RIFCSPHIGHO2_12_FULL_43_26]OGG32818.1 MAG: hypothetical protein A3G68_06035 [Cand
MIAKFSPQLQKELEKIYQKEKKLSDRIEKQIELFEENSKHPSLRTHKLSGNLKDMWSISVTSSMRMIYMKLDEDNALFVKIGTHDEVYEK